MKSFTVPLQELQGYEEANNALKKAACPIQISGCIDAVKPHRIYSMNNGSGNRVIVTFHEQKAKELYEEYLFFDKRTPVNSPKGDFIYCSVNCIASIKGKKLKQSGNSSPV